MARAGPIPLGCYKDPERTARTPPTYDGMRHSVPGDWCRVESDGSLTLLGRDSVCINTVGEKVYPEEVEEVLKTHAAVQDALVVGVPEERFGQAVAAVVEVGPGARAGSDVLREYVRQQLASYKVPRHVIEVSRIARGANGKLDYAAARRIVVERLGIVDAEAPGAGSGSA